MTPKKGLRKRQELSPEDVREVAIWEFTLREKTTRPNEGELRPRPELDSFDYNDVPNGATVRAQVTLADGTSFVGICSPILDSPQHALGYLQPAVLTMDGQVHFWRDREPTEHERERSYALLGRRADAVFPATVRADVPLGDGISGEATIRGFTFLEYEEIRLGAGLNRGEFRSGEVR